MNYIFLDIDGVLNGLNDLRNKPKTDGIDRYFNIEAYDRLAKICRINNAKVVLSSNWRHFLPRDNAAFQGSSNLIQKFLSLLKERNIELADSLPLDNKDRGAQILEYVEQKLHGLFDNWIVIDDEISDLTPYIAETRIVHTDTNYGLEDVHIYEATAKFNLGVNIEFCFFVDGLLTESGEYENKITLPEEVAKCLNFPLVELDGMHGYTYNMEDVENYRNNYDNNQPKVFATNMVEMINEISTWAPISGSHLFFIWNTDNQEYDWIQDLTQNELRSEHNLRNIYVESALMAIERLNKQ